MKDLLVIVTHLGDIKARVFFIKKEIRRLSLLKSDLIEVVAVTDQILSIDESKSESFSTMALLTKSGKL